MAQSFPPLPCPVRCISIPGPICDQIMRKRGTRAGSEPTYLLQ